MSHLPSSGKNAQAEIIREIRALLPPDAFQPNPRRLLGMGFILVVLFSAHAAVALTGASGWILGPIVVAALALASLALATHELAHGAVLRPGRLQRWCEVIFWTPLLISPTVWRRVHTQAHHAHTNTPRDPDRRYFHDEASTVMRWYVRIFYPNAELFPWNPLVFLHVGPYMARNTLSAFLPAKWQLPMVPSRVDYQPGDAGRIAFELGVMAAFQVGFFHLTGGEWLPYLIMAAGSQALTSAISMGYIFTNHFNNPLSVEVNQIRGSTSVIVPKWADYLHYNFSYHTEHHVFPTLNSDYYPLVSRHLQRLCPGVYQRIPIAQAWQRLWRNAPFIAKPGAPASTAG